MADARLERRSVWFSGRVQGVGFRYTARRLASGFDVVGTVRNLADGRVELIAEGEPREIDALLAAVGDHFGDSITNATSESGPAAGGFCDFAILR